MKIISKQKILQIFKELFKEYGIENINLEDFIFLSNKEGKIFIANADLKNFIDKIPFSNCGLYIMKIEGNKIRFSIEGSQIFGPLAAKKILELDLKKVFYLSDEMKINKVDINDGFYILKCGNDFGGTIFVKNKEVKDYVPKERKIYGDGTCMNEGNI
ncbi:MAG: hypothetical protein QXM04_00835 [Nanopusillaceae archaeon]